MKNTLSILLATILIFSISCQKEKEDNTEIQCTGDCLFTATDAVGTIVHMDCFNKYAIQTEHPEMQDSLLIYGIPDNMDSKFEVVGKTVHFSATFRENTIPLAFPDPSIDMGTIFQIKLEEINE